MGLLLDVTFYTMWEPMDQDSRDRFVADLDDRDHEERANRLANERRAFVAQVQRDRTVGRTRGAL